MFQSTVDNSNKFADKFSKISFIEDDNKISFIEDDNYAVFNNIMQYQITEKKIALENNNYLELTNKAITAKKIGTILNKEKDFYIPKIKTSFNYDTKNYSKVNYSWVGYVIAIGDKTFTARVEDTKTKTNIYEEAEFDIEDLDTDDLKSLQIGSVFYWSIGYEFKNGTKTKELRIRFRRLPGFNEKQKNEALDQSIDLYDNLNWVD